jgi:hypothetical protein
MSDEVIEYFFAWAPLAALLAVLIAAYAATRGKVAAAVAHGKTYACARCGRRGKREHMLPVTHEGAVVWYCERCSHAG